MWISEGPLICALEVPGQELTSSGTQSLVSGPYIASGSLRHTVLMLPSPALAISGIKYLQVPSKLTVTSGLLDPEYTC